MRVHVYAAIWIHDRLVVHRRRQMGHDHLTLPGGRVRERETVSAALLREVREEIALDIAIGDLLLACEVTGATLHGIALVFQATPACEPLPATLELADPDAPASSQIMPAVVDRLDRIHRQPSTGSEIWLGNIYDARRST